MSFIHNDNPRDLTAEDMHRLGVGKRFWGVSKDAIPDGCEYKQSVLRYLETIKETVHEGTGLMFYGDYRQGKTSAAIIVAKAVVAHGGTAYFIRASELVSSVLEKHRFDDDQTIMERLHSVDILVIDDVGAEHTGAAQFNTSLLERLVRFRYDNKKPLIVTSNLAPLKLKEVYGEGTLKVMRSMMRLVEVSCPDWYTQEVQEIL